MGLIYLAQERFAEAEDVYGRALDLAPGYALYLYHLGLSEYRQQKYQDAVESFIAATHGTLPLMEFDLQNAYYLTCALEKMDNEEGAQAAAEQMEKYRDALPPLQRQVANLPDYPHVTQTRADLADIEQRLSTLQRRLITVVRRMERLLCHPRIAILLLTLRSALYDLILDVVRNQASTHKVPDLKRARASHHQ